MKHLCLAATCSILALAVGCSVEPSDEPSGWEVRELAFDADPDPTPPPWNDAAFDLVGQCKSGTPPLKIFQEVSLAAELEQAPPPLLECGTAQSLANAYLEPAVDGFDHEGLACDVSTHSFYGAFECDDSCRGLIGSGAIYDVWLRTCFTCDNGIHYCIEVPTPLTTCVLDSNACTSHCGGFGCDDPGDVWCPLYSAIPYVCEPCVPVNSTTTYYRATMLPECDPGQECADGIGCCTPDPSYCVTSGAECGLVVDPCGNDIHCGSCSGAIGCTPDNDCIFPSCGDGSCNGTESCASCPGDCGSCGPSCGDGSCNGTESCATCPGDCGACGPSCGDGSCNGTETCDACPADCGACPPGGCTITCTDAWGGSVCSGDSGHRSCPTGPGVQACQCSGTGNWVDCQAGCIL